MGVGYSRQQSSITQLFRKLIVQQEDQNIPGSKLQQNALILANKMLLQNKGIAFNSKYEDINNVSYGAFSTVATAKHKTSGEIVAVKIIPKTKIQWIRFSQTCYTRQHVLTEIANLRIVQSHENAIVLKEVFEDERHFYLVTEYYSGGELFEHIEKKRNTGFREQEAAVIMKNILEFLKYCHSLGLVHADLKPENIVFSSDKPDAILKIIDFGLSLFCRPYEKKNNFFGTIKYCSPEMAKCWCNQKSDIWSAGVLMYFMLSGKAPFQYKNKAMTLNALKRNPKVTFCGNRWQNVTNQAKDLIRKLLAINPEDRPAANEALKHPWFSSMSKIALNSPLSNISTVAESIANKIEDFRFFDSLKKFSQMSRLKRLILERMARKAPSDQINNHLHIFQKLDLDNNGTIDLVELISAIKKEEPYLDEENIKELFIALDVNRSGGIDKSEFIAANLSYLPPEFQFKLAESSFEELDIKRDGLICIDKLKEMLLADVHPVSKDDDDEEEVSDNALDLEIKKMDVNKDGLISLDEYYFHSTIFNISCNP